MVKISEIVKGPHVKARRKALGISQAELAKKVRELSKQKFSQQALAKFERNSESNSVFTIYILDALASFEDERGLDKVIPLFRPREQPDPEYEQLKAASTPEQRIQAFSNIAAKVSLKDAATIARIFLERIESGL